MACDNLMKDRINVQRPTYAADSAGGAVATYTTIYQNIPACVQNSRIGWLFIYLQSNITFDYYIFLNQKLTLLSGDVIIYKGQNLYYNGSYDIVQRGIVQYITVSQFRKGVASNR